MRVIFIRKRPMLYFLILVLVFVFLYFAGKQFYKKTVPTINPIYIGNTNQNALALMVNVDWGAEILPAMLGVFKDKSVKATFFISGKFAKNNPQLVSAVYEDGHEIGNHGYSHPHPDNLSIAENEKEIVSTEEAFNNLNVKWSKLFAPPYGEHKEHVVKAAENQGYKTIMWTLDTIDWKEPSPQTIINKLVQKADNGSLILMHPKKCTLDALPKVIDSLKAKDFTFVTVSEIIQ